MTAEVSALREGDLAVSTGEGSYLGVLPEVLMKVGALLEHFIAVLDSAGKIELFGVCVFPDDFDGLVPLTRNAPERLGGLEVKDLPRALAGI